MRESVIFLLICVIVNKVTAPAPFYLPKTNLPQPKPTTSTTTTSKPPKWNDYVSKNSGSKPMKDNAYLATLVNMPPKDNTKQKNEINKVEGNRTNIENNEKEYLNSTRVLFAEEIVSSPNLLSKNDSKHNEILPSIGQSSNGLKDKEYATEIKKGDMKYKLNNTEPKKGVKLQELLKPLLTKSKVNNTDVQAKSFEIPPTMIPIFRPNPNLTRKQVAKDNLDSTFITSKPDLPIQELPALTEDVIPSKNVKPNLNLNSNVPFNIPCHRASDILDEVPVKSEISHAPHANIEPIAKSENSISQEPNQVERPQKLETDESLAIIFKPKNISLLNVYGDMLKKITLTVLVPYHMSKLGI